MNDHWTLEDYTADRCAFAQVGKARDDSAPVIDIPPDDGKLSPSDRLKRDAMLAYSALGGPEYLRRNPDLLDKTLLKLVAEPPLRADINTVITINAPWMSPERLSYAHAPPLLDVIDAPTRQYPSEASPIPPADPDVLARADALRKLPPLK